MCDHTIVIIWFVKIFFVQFSVYSCHLFLIPSASVRSIPFLSFIEPIFAWSVPLICLKFLKRCLVFPILLFSSISLHWSLRKAFLSLLAILWNSGYIVWNGIQRPFLQGGMKGVKYSEIKMVQNDTKWYWHKRNNSPEMKGSMAVIMVRYWRELMLTESRGLR